MKALLPINLNDDWHYLFNEFDSDKDILPTDQSKLDRMMWVPLESLSDWLIASTAATGTDWFRRSISLDADAVDYAYRLQIDKVPDDVKVYVNGELVGIAEGRRAFTSDITRFVRRGVNNILIRLSCKSCDSGGGRFGNISILPSPLERVARVH